MKFPSELLNRLAEHNITVYLDKTGNVKVRLPTGDLMSLPEEVKELLRELKTNKEQVREYLAWLKNPTIEVTPGVVVRLHKTRPGCMTAGYCKQVTHEDCNLFPVTKEGKLSGFCRERVPAKGGSCYGRASKQAHHRKQR